MEKPLSMILKESKETIVNCINETNLSLVLLEPIIKDIYMEIHNLAEAQTQREIQEYYRLIEESKTTEESSN